MSYDYAKRTVFVGHLLVDRQPQGRRERNRCLDVADAVNRQGGGKLGSQAAPPETRHRRAGGIVRYAVVKRRCDRIFVAERCTIRIGDWSPS